MEKPPRFLTLKNCLIIFSCLLCLGIYLFVADQLLRSFSTHDTISLRRNSYVSILEGRKKSEGPLTPSYIKGWMTFAYIDHLFDLPPQYLQTELKLSDADYPNISLNEYADKHNLNRTLFTASVITKVTDEVPANKKTATSSALLPSLLPAAHSPLQP